MSHFHTDIDWHDTDLLRRLASLLCNYTVAWSPLNPQHEAYTTGVTEADEWLNEQQHLRGMFLFLVGMLAVIQNNENIETSPPRRAIAGKRFVSGKLVQYLQHRTVTLAANRTVAEATARYTHPVSLPPLSKAAKRRLHEVMGHWVHSRKKEPRAPGCKCEYRAVEDRPTQEVCAHCGHKRWFRDHHTRGDANHGLFVKDAHRVKRAEVTRP